MLQSVILYHIIFGGFMVKLIVSDMDGTLIGEKMSISQKNLNAIAHATQKGVTFAIATGRHLKEAIGVLDNHGIKCPLITANGAAIYNTDRELINVFALPKQVTLDILKIARKYDSLLVELATVDTVFSDEPEKSLAMLERFIRHHLPEADESEIKEALNVEKEQMTTVTVNSLEEIVTNADDDYVLKFFITTLDESDALLKFKNAIASIPGIVITSSHHTNVEINSVNATKGIAVEALAKSLDIELSNVMALGDNFNDFSMISTVGLGVAMGNAAPEIKNIAKYITNSNLNDGVAEAIYHFVQ